MDLSQYREQIDQIDDELIALFARRMETAAQIAQWKRQAGKPVMDATATKTKTISVRLRRVIYAAACVAVMIVVSLTVLLGGNDNQKLADSRTKTNEPTYAETHETTVDEVADLAMMDNSDIYAYLSYDYYQE